MEPLFMSLAATSSSRPAANWKPRAFGIVMIVLGIAGWIYNHHLVATEGAFYIRLCIFSPLAVFGGLLVAVRPEWIGPVRKDSPPAQKTATWVVIGLMAVVSGIDLYLLNTAQVPERFRAPAVIHWTPEMGTPK
jgi:hypothetical protein